MVLKLVDSINDQIQLQYCNAVDNCNICNNVVYCNVVSKGGSCSVVM